MTENSDYVDPIPGRPMHHFAILHRTQKPCCAQPKSVHPYQFELYTRRVKYNDN